MDASQDPSNRSDWLRRELSEGPGRTPPISYEQMRSYWWELCQLLGETGLVESTRPHVDVDYIRQLGHIPGCHLYDTDGKSLAG